MHIYQMVVVFIVMMFKYCNNSASKTIAKDIVFVVN